MSERVSKRKVRDAGADTRHEVEIPTGTICVVVVTEKGLHVQMPDAVPPQQVVEGAKLFATLVRNAVDAAYGDLQ